MPMRDRTASANFYSFQFFTSSPLLIDELPDDRREALDGWPLT